MRCPCPHQLAHSLARRMVRTVARHLAACREETGAAVLEFGLVLPIVLMAILGVIQYGYHFWSLETAAAAAREGARRLIVGTDWGCTQAEAVQSASGPALGGVAPVVTRRYHTESGTTLSGPVVGDLVTVTVTFQSLDMQIPFLPVPHNGTVTETGVGRIEVVPPQRLACDRTQNTLVGGTY
jgi:Flp pilus assembly protein TadG